MTADRFATLAQRLAAADELDAIIGAATSTRVAGSLADDLIGAGIPASIVKSPPERIDGDPDLARIGLFPNVSHPDIGKVRVEGLPMTFSATPWSIDRSAPKLGQHNREIFGGLLGHDDQTLQDWAGRGVI